MSISAAFASAVSGLRATARQADVLSSNVANATTPGYAKREVLLSAQNAGGAGQGVRVDGVSRDVNLFLLNDRRAAQAGAANAGIQADFLKRLESIIGDPAGDGSLVSRVDRFDAALIAAASRPESEAALNAATDAARGLADGLRAASDRVQAERLAADGGIGNAVDRLNDSLKRVEELNASIVTATASGHDATALMDQRARLVDEISGLVPVRELARPNNTIALVTAGGAVLVDGKAARFGFTPAGAMSPDANISSGALSGLQLNGRDISTTGSSSLIRGGELEGLFQIRDDLAVTGQQQLDTLARDLIERFSASGLDPTLAPGAAGLFTDEGASFVPADETGIAARITLNGAVDPSNGGAVWKLRDGLGASAPGPAGYAGILNALSSQIQTYSPTGSGAVSPGARNLSGLAAEILSMTSVSRLSAADEQAFRNAKLNSLSDQEAARGVNIDEEMQSLLVLEKTYAANARVIRALDEMLANLLGI